MNSHPKILKYAFEVLRSVNRSIQPYNIYNMDGKGLQMGKSARVKVICVRGRSSPPLMKDGNHSWLQQLKQLQRIGLCFALY